MVLSDSFYYQPVQIDTINTRVFADLVAKEGDANGRGMVVQITENGIIKDTTGITLRLQWSHISVGTSGFTDFEVVDATKGLYKLIYPTSMLRRGRVEAFIRITDNGILSGTRNLFITVERMVGSDETIEAADDFSALQSALTRLSIWEATISGKVDTWEADMEATKQTYITTMNDVEATYPQELISLGSQLAEKVDVGGVEQVGLGMLTQAVRLGMTGGSVAVVGDDSINLTNVVDKAINGGKCSFIDTKQYNLYNEASSVLGYQILMDGSVSANAGAKLSDYIKVEPNTIYTCTGTDTRSMAFFDDAKQYVSGLAKAPSSGKYTFTVPTGCYYVRITYTRAVSNILICKTVNYDGTYYAYNTEDIELKRVVNEFETKNIKNDAVTYEKADFITTGKNLLDSAKSSDYYLSASSGSVVSSVTYRLSEFIKVEPNTDYVISPSCRHFLAYDVDKKAITASYMSTNTTNYTFNSGDTYEYIRFDYYTNKESTTQLEKGVAPTGYERYGYEIPKLLIDENENVLKDNSILTIGDSIVAGDGNNGIGIGDILATRNGMTVTDYSKGGATVWYDDVDAASANEQVKRQNIQYQVDQAILNVTSPDFILFDGYANDISALAPLGEISDGYTATLDKYTFSGGFEYCVKTLKTNFPEAKLIYIRVHNMGSRFYSNQLLYGNRAVELCEKWSVKVVDLFKECGLNTNLTEYKQYTNNADKTHPTQTGYDIFYMPLIETTMKSVVNA